MAGLSLAEALKMEVAPYGLSLITTRTPGRLVWYVWYGAKSEMTATCD